MKRFIAFAIFVLLTQVAFQTSSAQEKDSAQNLEKNSAEKFTVSGTVLDAAGKPVAGSTIIPLSVHGVPIGLNGAPVTMATLSSGDKGDFVTKATSNASGEFKLTLFPGGYRIVAQTWLDKTSITKVLDDNGSRLRLDGVINVEFHNSMEASETLEIKPAGTASAKLSSQESSDMLLISQKPLAGDPALGFVALAGDFWSGLLAGTKMEKKQILISGLPAGPIQFFSFVNDNNGGMGGTLATLTEGMVTDVYVGVIAGWSNGHRTPPPELKDLTKHFSDNPDEAGNLQLVIKEFQELLMPEDGNEPSEANRMAGVQGLAKHLDDEIELLNGEKVTLGDAMAAMAYARMQKKK